MSPNMCAFNKSYYNRYPTNVKLETNLRQLETRRLHQFLFFMFQSKSLLNPDETLMKSTNLT